MELMEVLGTPTLPSYTKTTPSITSTQQGYWNTNLSI